MTIERAYYIAFWNERMARLKWLWGFILLSSLALALLADLAGSNASLVAAVAGVQ